MRTFDEQTYNRFTPAEKNQYVGFVVDNSNNYIVFEPGDESEYEVLKKQVEEKGRSETDFSKYLRHISQSPRLKSTDKLLPGFQGKLPGDEKLEGLLEELYDDDSKLTLKKCKELLKELFKNHVN